MYAYACVSLRVCACICICMYIYMGVADYSIGLFLSEFRETFFTFSSWGILKRLRRTRCPRLSTPANRFGVCVCVCVRTVHTSRWHVRSSITAADAPTRTPQSPWIRCASAMWHKRVRFFTCAMRQATAHNKKQTHGGIASRPCVLTRAPCDYRPANRDFG